LAVVLASNLERVVLYAQYIRLDLAAAVKSYNNLFTGAQPREITLGFLDPDIASRLGIERQCSCA
jgi:hypothetical protein